jgi:Family of unknown function (DUF6221)
MNDLVEFLRARLDEDERAALNVRPDQDYSDSAHQERWSPARVLREVEAKRAIVDDYEDAAAICRAALAEDTYGKTHPRTAAGAFIAYQATARNLAGIWRDHPDYQQGWALNEAAPPG